MADYAELLCQEVFCEEPITPLRYRVYASLASYSAEKFTSSLINMGQILKIIEATDCGMDGFVAAMFYYGRLSAETIKTLRRDGQVPFPCIVLALAVLASKFLYDEVYGNVTVCRQLARVSLTAFNSLEGSVFAALGHDAFISMEEMLKSRIEVFGHELAAKLLTEGAHLCDQTHGRAVEDIDDDNEVLRPAKKRARTEVN